MEEKIKVYELDFGDQNLLSTSIKDITDWISSDLSDLKPGDESLNYEINIRMMTQKEIDDLPEWGN